MLAILLSAAVQVCAPYGEPGPPPAPRSVLCWPRAIEGQNTSPVFGTGRVTTFNPSAIPGARPGQIRAKMLVSADGAVTSVTILSSSGYREIDRDYVTRAKAQRYRPALLDGRPVAVWVEAGTIRLAHPAEERPPVWLPVLETRDSSVSLDTTRIRRLDRDQLEIWDRREYLRPQELRGELYDRVVSKSRVRCGVQRSRALESSLFRGDQLVRGSGSFSPGYHWSMNGLDRFTDAVIATACRLSPSPP